MKKERQLLISKIIKEEPISTQNQLIEALQRHGVEVTQATLSRDMKDLRLIKCKDDDGNCYYAIDDSVIPESFMHKLERIFKQGVFNVTAVNNLIIIKTMPGLAQGIGSFIDQMRLENLAGCVCGNDTALVVMTDNASAELFCNDLLKLKHRMS